MQETYEMPALQKAPSPVREALRLATQKLGRGQGTLALLLTLLLGMMLGFATYLFATVFLQVLFGYTALPAGAMVACYYALLVILFVPLATPVFVGRIRMAGMVARGNDPALCEALYYYASPRRLLRGIGMGVLWIGSIICLPAFGAVALAAGNDQLSLHRAFCLACKRGVPYTGAILRFWLCTLWHILLSALTLGVLWLLYYAHHTTVAYFELTMIMMDDPKGELQ